LAGPPPVSEALQRPDGHEEGKYREDRHDARQRDVEKGLDGVRAVDLGGLVEFLLDGLQRCQDHQRVERKYLPHGHQD
jgi:hypothetical protein